MSACLASFTECSDFEICPCTHILVLHSFVCLKNLHCGVDHALCIHSGADEHVFGLFLVYVSLEQIPRCRIAGSYDDLF